MSKLFVNRTVIQITKIIFAIISCKFSLYITLSATTDLIFHESGRLKYHKYLTIFT